MSDNRFERIDEDDDVQISVEESGGIPPDEVSTEANDEPSDLITPSLFVNQDEVQRRTFSHWPHRSPEFIHQMIEAGFYGCNVGDRVICLKCNLVFQGWRPQIDDPCDVHRRLSPNCEYVRSKLLGLTTGSSPPHPPSPPSPMFVIDFSSTANLAQHSVGTAPHIFVREPEGVVLKTPQRPDYAEVPKRRESFVNWSYQNSPSADHFVRAGFFYTGVKGIVTCFYCNGSLQNWGFNDNPTIEHARRFPHCGYAYQLCGSDLYRAIQEAQRRQSQSAVNMCQRGNLDSRSNASNLTINRLLTIPDGNILNLLVAARLDLPISQRLINMGCKLSIIKRCWEDQLRIKEQDFHSLGDLFTTCLILQKQIEQIAGKKENIIIPRNVMGPAGQNTVHSNQMLLRQPAQENRTALDNCLSENTVPSTTSSVPVTTVNNEAVDLSRNTEESLNLCVLCLTEERRLACIPCGHLVVCVPCSHALKTCPMCRKNINAFVRIYL